METARNNEKDKETTGRGVDVLGRIVWGVVVTIVVLMVISLFAPPMCKPLPVAQRLVCGMNLNSLGKAISMYASEYDGWYPTADKWCDLLVEKEELPKKIFVCKASDTVEGQSSYAFNRNLAGKKMSEAPPDVVLSFEASTGWNQVGGPEILSTEHHKGGCNVLFNDGHVEFVKTEDLGKLTWEVGDSKNVTGD